MYQGYFRIYGSTSGIKLYIQQNSQNLILQENGNNYATIPTSYGDVYVYFTCLYPSATFPVVFNFVQGSTTFSTTWSVFTLIEVGVKSKDLYVNPSASFSNNLSDTSLTALTVSGTSTFSDTATHNGSAVFNGTTTFTNTVNVNGNSTYSADATFNAIVRIQPTAVANRKLVLWNGTNNDDHQFYGFGVNSGILRYQVDGTGSSHVWYCGVSTTTSTELMRLTGGGRLGIGKASPAAALDVEGTIRVSNGAGGYLSVNAADSAHTGYVNFYNSDQITRMGYIGYGDSSNFYFNIELTRNLLFSTNGIERMRISDDGRVSISNNANGISPLAVCKLYVHDSATAGWAGMTYHGGNTTGIVCGSYNNQAHIGAHNKALNAWTDTYLCPGGDLYLPNVQQTPYGNVNSANLYFLTRSPGGMVGKGILRWDSLRTNSRAWSSGTTYSSFVTKPAITSTVVITGHVTCYTSSVSTVNVFLRFNPVGTANYWYFYTNQFFNQTYSHTPIPIHYVLSSGDLPASGDYDVYLGTTSPNLITDSNDVVMIEFLTIG
jgi:hypothetical protein